MYIKNEFFINYKFSIKGYESRDKANCNGSARKGRKIHQEGFKKVVISTSSLHSHSAKIPYSTLFLCIPKPFMRKHFLLVSFDF